MSLVVIGTSGLLSSAVFLAYGDYMAGIVPKESGACNFFHFMKFTGAVFIPVSTTVLIVAGVKRALGGY